MSKPLLFRAVWLCGLLLSAAALAQSPQPIAQVMLIGTFHFSDPGQDAVQTRSLDVTTAEAQRFLDELSRKIAAEFKPTRVLLEYSPSSEAPYLSSSFLIFFLISPKVSSERLPLAIPGWLETKTTL